MPQSLTKTTLVPPVFSDPTRHRWQAVKSLVTLGFLLMIGLFSVLLVRVLNTPELIGPELQTQHHRVVVQQPDALDMPDVSNTGIAADATGFFPEATVTNTTGSVQ